MENTNDLFGQPNTRLPVSLPIISSCIQDVFKGSLFFLKFIFFKSLLWISMLINSLSFCLFKILSWPSFLKVKLNKDKKANWELFSLGIFKVILLYISIHCFKMIRCEFNYHSSVGNLSFPSTVFEIFSLWCTEKSPQYCGCGFIFIYLHW